MEKADKPITSIATKSSKESHYNLLGLKDYDKTKTITGIDPENIVYHLFDTEKELLQFFIKIWKQSYPDVITGWNVEYFDVMYIITRIMAVFTEEKAKELSPWGVIKKKTVKTNFGKEQSTYEIMGMSVLDYIDAFKKFGYKYGTQESYKLDQVAYTVLGEKKLSYEEYGSLTALYEQNPQLYLDYNLKDTHLIQRFEDETALLSLVLTVAYGGGVNFKEAFGTVGIWDTTIYRRVMRSNIVPLVKSLSGRGGQELVGGYVKEPKIGMYKWVVSFDLNSLYPHLMMQYNMSPETYDPKSKNYVTQEMILAGEYKNEDKSVSVAANGAGFRNETLGVIPSIINEYYDKRAAVKRTMLGVESEIEAIKEEMAKRKATA
jgi:DNA polymerase elongation subunit (family B)